MADPQLKIRIAGDLTSIRTALNELRSELSKFATQASATGQKAQKSFQNVEGILARTAKAAKSLVALGGLALLGRQLAQMADQAALLDAKLRLATKSQEEYNVAAAGTLQIAQKTRTSLEATIDLYTRLERST